MDRDPKLLMLSILSDMLISSRLVRSYVEGIYPQSLNKFQAMSEFLQDTKLQDSVVRRLEIIKAGEAAMK